MKPPRSWSLSWHDTRYWRLNWPQTSHHMQRISAYHDRQARWWAHEAHRLARQQHRTRRISLLLALVALLAMVVDLSSGPFSPWPIVIGAVAGLFLGWLWNAITSIRRVGRGQARMLPGRAGE